MHFFNEIFAETDTPVRFNYGPEVTRSIVVNAITCSFDRLLADNEIQISIGNNIKKTTKKIKFIATNPLEFLPLHALEN